MDIGCRFVIRFWHSGNTSMATLSIKLSDSLHARLVELARRRGTTRSRIAREALEAATSRGGRTFEDLAGHLAGSVRGPRDLSTNPRHMAGFGR